MVKVFISDISSLRLPDEKSEFFSSLPDYRKEKILSLIDEEKKKQSFGAALLLRYALREYGLSDKDVYLGEKGKPLCPGISFSLSHSFDKVVCAIGETDVGCDIEKIRKAPKERIHRFFTEEERAFLTTAEDWDKAFFSLWTKKESYVKMTGEGLIKTLTDYTVLDTAGRFNVKQWEKDGYILSVCSKESIEEIQNIVLVEEFL